MGHRRAHPAAWAATSTPCSPSRLFSTTSPQDALPPIVAVAEQVNTNTFSPKGGKIDLAALASIEPSVSKADEALTAARDEISDIDPDRLLTPLGDPVRNVQDKIVDRADGRVIRSPRLQAPPDHAGR